MKKLTEKQIDKIDTKFTLDNGIFAVLVDTTGDKTVSGREDNASIYCINENYKIIWQVQYPPNSFEEDADYEYSDPFVWMGFDESERRLYANKFRGTEYEIDIETGVAKIIGWHK